MEEKHESFDKNIIFTEKPYYEIAADPGGVGKVFFDKMAVHGDVPAQIDGLTGKIDTYSALLKRCTRTAIKMRSKGIEPDDIISICSPAHLNRCVPYYAGLFLGAIPACFDPSMPLTDLTHLLTLVRPKMVFVHSDSVPVFESALNATNSKAELVVFGESSEHSKFSEFLEESCEEEDFRPILIEDLRKTVLIFFSSGTTGKIKSIAVNHFGFLSQLNVLMNVGFPDDVILVYVSMFWIAWTSYTSYSILNRGCIVVVPKFELNQVWDLVLKYKVTMLPLSTHFAVQLQDAKFPENVDFGFLKNFLIGGTYTEESLVEGFRKKFPKTPVFVAYGQSEASGALTAFNMRKEEDRALSVKKPATTGRPIPGIAYKVVDPNTERILGPNETGELRIKTDFQMNGYYKLNNKDTDAWDSDGWLKTGDVVYYDEDRCFYVIDRLKEIIRVQGWHVSPSLLESLLLAHPAVEDAVVVGLPDPFDWEHPCGVVVLKSEFDGKVSSRDIQTYVDERVDERKKLKGGVRIVGRIPVTTSGKKKRLELRDMIVRGDI